MYLLDASAVLAYLKNEPGWEEVRDILKESVCISCINLAEIAFILKKYSTSKIDFTQELLTLIDEVHLVIIPYGENELAGTLSIPSTKFPLSLGDRACLGTALAHNYCVITTDRQWLSLKLPLDIRITRPIS